MRKLRHLFFIFNLTAVFFMLAAGSLPAPVFSAGCLHHEPDRDGDGVADEKDPYPDDPTRSTDADRFPSMRISLIPSSENTEGPVDEFNIDEKSSVVIWVFENEDLFQSVKKIVDREPALPVAEIFDENALRLKIEFPKDQTTFYVDKAGVVSKDEETKSVLTPEEFQSLEKTVLGLRGIVDLKENKNLCQELPIEDDELKLSLPAADGKPVLQIAMIPFSSPQTESVAPTDLSEKAQITIALYQNSEVVTGVRSVLQGDGAGAALGAETIRFQADFPADGISIIVDKDGGMSQNGESKSTLSADDLKFLEDQANRMRGVVDMRVQARLCSLEQ